MIAVEFKPIATEQIRRLIQGQKGEVGVRIYAQPGGGGCGCGGGSAVMFGMAFSKARADDTVVKVDGFSLLVDPSSQKFVDGAVVEERQPYMRGGAQEPLTRADIEEKFLLNVRHGGWSGERAATALGLIAGLFDGPVDLEPLRG